MKPLKIVAFLFALILTAAIIWAIGEKPMGESFSAMIRDPWGVVTLIDLYWGFIAFAVVVSWFEKPWVTAILFVLLCVLGNVVSMLWLAFRGLGWARSQLR
ncbi:MAG: hypothetical protein FGM26_07210 [Beijerinckiaceae bacterium]|nr:hypothetical protein [Beijerinckiaceae bacterium]